MTRTVRLVALASALGAAACGMAAGPEKEATMVPPTDGVPAAPKPEPAGAAAPLRTATFAVG